MTRLLRVGDRVVFEDVEQQVVALTGSRVRLVGPDGTPTAVLLATFSYISPLLTHTAGFTTTAVPVVLVGYGIGSLIGTNVAGRFADRRPLATYITAAAATAAIMALIVA